MFGVFALLVLSRPGPDPAAGVPRMTEAAAAELVTAAARDAVVAARLERPAGGRTSMSCASATGPPYRPVVHMTFALPEGNTVGYLNRVAADLVADGWADSGVVAEYFGKKLTRGGVVAVFYRNPERLDVATMRLSGECAVDAVTTEGVWTEIGGRLRAGS
ncbi:hypothetical protein ACFQWH_23980 [Mycolicibacterium sp. GCM10028919]|uniref:hypothetical protein n=1 Tax=Mycolicibacterium sp. GCM10028919 TaxID=3273401 RepID=UPI003622ED82